MTDEVPPAEDLNYLRLMVVKRRKSNSYWDWPDKPVKERGIVCNILQDEDVVGLISRDERDQPPDCEATLGGRLSGIEVTELVDRQTLEQSIRGPKVYLDWNQQEFLSALQARIDDKDKPWRGGPYERRVLVVHTDEFVLDRERVDRFLRGSVFHTKLITHVFLGLSYHPSTEPDGKERYPVFRLNLAGAS